MELTPFLLREEENFGMLILGPPISFKRPSENIIIKILSPKLSSFKRIHGDLIFKYP